MSDVIKQHHLKLMVLGLDAALEFHPGNFTIDGDGGIFYEGEPIPWEVVAQLEPNDFSYMLDMIIDAALKHKTRFPPLVAAA